MTLRVRPFQPADMPALQAALARWAFAAGPCGYCHGGALFNQIHEQFRGRQPLDQLVQVWEDPTEIVGVAINFRYATNFVCYVAPQHRDTPAERTMLEHAAAITLRYVQQSGQRPAVVTTDLHGCDLSRAALLAELGFVRERVWDWITRRSVEPPLSATLPPGYTVRSATLADAAQLAALRNDAFDADWTAAQYRAAVMAQPGYALNHERVVVAPDGSLAALTIVWLDAVNRVGLLEPVATHSAHRRRGLARALIADALALMGRAGMHTAQIEHDASNTAARALYAGLGFVPIDTSYGYRRG